MSKNIRVIYLYLVCLIMLILSIGGFIFTFNSLGDYFFPTTYSNIGTVNYENSRIESLKTAITSFATFIVSGLIFMYNWRKIEKERKEMEE